MPKTRKNYYNAIRNNSSKIDILDFVKVPEFNPKEENDILKVSGKNIDSELISLLKNRAAKMKYNVKDDFYSFINEDWLENMQANVKKKKTFYVKQDDIRIIQEDTVNSLLKVLKMNHKQKLVFESFKNIQSSHMVSHIQTLSRTLKSIFARNNFYELMTFIHKNPLFSSAFPISWVMTMNLKNSKYYCNNIYPANLTFFDYAYYSPIPPSDKKKHDYQQKLYTGYHTYISQMFQKCGIPLKSEDVFQCEIDLLGCFNGNLRESEEQYNKINLQTAKQFGFDWDVFTKMMGFSSTPDYFITTSVNYLANVMKLMKDWNTPKWHSYWFYICLKQMIKFSKSLSVIDYNFNGKFISGVVEPFPDYIRGFLGLSMCYNTYLSNEFSKNFRDENVIRFVTKLLNELHSTFIHMVKRNKWLSPPSKMQALKKINHLQFDIGTIKKLMPDPNLNYNNDAWNNLMLQNSYYINKLIGYTNKPFIQDNRNIDWQSYPPKFGGNQNYIVNAYYIPTENAIFIPLGILQDPFVKLHESLEYNLSTVGYTVCHEMSHSLDNNGSKFDYKGNLNNWWTPSDKKIFDKFVNDVIHQYEVVAKYDGIIWDATNSAGEDLADISGLFILEEYLRNNLITNNEILQVDILKLRLFFAYFAQQNRQNIYKQAIPMLLITNPHPLNKYRANCPLSRVGLFKYIFDIKKGDKMFWPDTNKLW